MSIRMVSYTGHASMIVHKAAMMKNGGMPSVHFGTEVHALSGKTRE